MRASSFALLFLALPLGCIFPEIDVVSTGGGGHGGGGVTSTTSASTASSSTSATTTTTSSTTSGQGGSDPCDVDADGMESKACDGPDCDDDGDMAPNVDFDCGGDDCDDADGRVFPTQTVPQAPARANGSWDFNCDTVEDPEFDTACGICPGQILVGVEPGPAGCGQAGNKTACAMPLVTCDVGMIIESNVTQRCL